MNTLITNLRNNAKVAVVETKTIESLEERIQYDFVIVRVKSPNEGLKKSTEMLCIKPDGVGAFKVRMYVGKEPKDTLLHDIYEDHRAEIYGKDQGYINLKKVPRHMIPQLVNWKYSTIN